MTEKPIVFSKDEELEVLVGGDIDSAPIKFCEEHHDKLYQTLCQYGLDPWIAKSEEEIQNKIKNNQFDALLVGSGGLMKLALRTIGGVGIIECGGCPVCALNQFDFIAQMAQLIKNKISEKMGSKQ